MTYVPVSELSAPLRDALASVRYGAADIQVIPAESVEPAVGGGSGQRGFIIGVNLDTGQREGIQGSWGGSNPWSDSPVDHAEGRSAIPTNGAIVKGTTGHPRTFATIYAHPDVFGRLLPSGESEQLSAVEEQAIYCFAGLKGEYRRQELARRSVSSDVIDSLVERGYLKRNRAGATSITTKGKNARNPRVN